MDRAVILYDAECGFCRWSLAKVLAWDRRKALRPLALQSPEASRLLPEMSRAERMGSWHLVTPDGRVHSAGAAVAPLARLLPAGRPIVAAASSFPRATERLYRFVARHRDGLARLVHAGSQASS